MTVHGRTKSVFLIDANCVDPIRRRRQVSRGDPRKTAPRCKVSPGNAWLRPLRSASALPLSLAPEFAKLQHARRVVALMIEDHQPKSSTLQTQCERWSVHYLAGLRD